MMVSQRCHFVTGALALLCWVYLAPTQALPLPSYLEACSRSDPNLNDCALKNGRKALTSLVKGDRKYLIPVLDPLAVDEMRLDIEGGLTMAARNVSLRGFRKTDLKKVSIDIKKQHFAVEMMVPLTEIICKYEMNGQILVLPISGAGDANISLYDAFYTFKSDYDLVKKSDGKEYLQLKVPKLEFTPKNVRMHLDNLFNGDKVLGSHMNTFLNENWKDVLQELGPALAEGIAEIAKSIIAAVANHVPYDELFKE